MKHLHKKPVFAWRVLPVLFLSAVLLSLASCGGGGGNGGGGNGGGGNGGGGNGGGGSTVLTGVTAISTGSRHTCVLHNTAGDGETEVLAAQCWGSNSHGLLGNGRSGISNDSAVPVPVMGLDSGVDVISAGSAYNCAVHKGIAKCWGDNNARQLGNGSRASESEPKEVLQTAADNSDTANPIAEVKLGSGVTAIAAGGEHTCALQGGAAWCWGLNNDGQLGHGTLVSSGVAKQLSTLTSKVTAITVGSNHTCALHNIAVEGASEALVVAKCWGGNSFGQLGDGTRTVVGVNNDRKVPVEVVQSTTPEVKLGSGVTAIDAGDQHTCVIQGGVVKCWGRNLNGQLGNGSSGSSNDSPLPVQVMVLTSDVNAKISAGDQHTCALQGGAARCWGNNDDGQLGRDSSSSVSNNIPAEVRGLDSGVDVISAGSAYNCAVQDGSAICWGSNFRSKLGPTVLP